MTETSWQMDTPPRMQSVSPSPSYAPFRGSFREGDLGLVVGERPAEAERLLDAGETDLGGRIPINISGGSSSFGEATPAQGLLLACEIVTQLRGQAGPRQVEGAKVGLGQVYGARGNSGTTIWKK